MSTIKSVNQIINKPGSGLDTIVTRTTQLRHLTQLLQQLLDTPINQHVYVANVRDTTLVIGTDSAVWHARVKYLAPMILEHIKQKSGLDKLSRIEFRVQPFSANFQSKTPNSLE
ncbi:MAG: DUF721 domain-containing protein [Gammaproteobacteria bacterium]|nr:DUF721 domain-containing protein [Gammaproteobacteria bacterium]